MRKLLYAAIVLAACAPGDRSRSSAGPAQKYAGTWEGRSFRSASDTGTPWRIVTAVVQDGSLRGTMTYTSVTAPPVRFVRSVHRRPRRNADAAPHAGGLRGVLLAAGRPACDNGGALVGRPKPLERLGLRAGRPRRGAAPRGRRRARLELPPRNA